jgi:hypothetical protein
MYPLPHSMLMVSVLDLDSSAPLSAAHLPCPVLVERQWWLMSPFARQRSGGGGDGGACEDDHGDHGCRGRGDRRRYSGQGYKPCLLRHLLPVHNALADHRPTRRREPRLEVPTSQPHASGSWRMPHQSGKDSPAWSTSPAGAN